MSRDDYTLMSNLRAAAIVIRRDYKVRHMIERAELFEAAVKRIRELTNT